MGLIFKIFCGLFLGIVYQFYYKYAGDTFTFHKETYILTQIFEADAQEYFRILFADSENYIFSQPLQFACEPRTFFMIKILSIVEIFTQNNYWLSSCYFSMFSFLGMWALSNILVRIFPATRWAIILAFLLFPSVVFFSAGIAKECVIMGCLSFFMALFLRHFWIKKLTWLYILFAFLNLWIVWQIKYYYLAILLPCLILYILSEFVLKKYPSLSYGKLFMGLLPIALLVIVVVSQFHPNFWLSRFTEVIYSHYHFALANSQSEGVILYPTLKKEVWSIVINSPKALISGLYRPFIWEAHNWLQIWIAVENLFIILMSFYSIYVCFKKNTSTISKRQKLLIIFTLLYIILLAIFLAFTAPNFGTLTRYKIAFMPFLIYLACILPFQRYLNFIKVAP